MSNFKRHILLMAFVLLPHYAFNQTIITGQIKNTSNKPLSNVSIVIYENNSIIGYSYSNGEGKYQINIDKLNITILKIAANILGYKPQEKIIQLQKETTKIDFILEEHFESLNEVVLEAWEKINIKKDTITFKAIAFKDGSEQVVEDLLKNIPGIEVSNNGNIKVNGKAIDKLLIEGDDLFDDKYKLLTKNLDANTIKEVQILNNFEDNPVLKSFQESEKVALNLNLKDDKKNVWFGNLDIGLGTNVSYNSSANIGLLKKKIKLFNLSNLNNISQTAVSQVKNTSTISYTGVNTDKNIEKKNNEIVNIDNSISPNFTNNENVFNDSFLNSLSFVTNLSEKTKLRSLSYFTFDKIENQNSNLTEYFIEPETIKFTEQNNISINDLSFATELELNHYSKNETYYTYDFTFETNPTRKKGNLIFNDSLIKQLQKDKKYNFFNHLNATKKISNNKLLLFYAYLGLNKTKQDFKIEPNIFNDIFQNEESLTIRQNSSSPLTYYGIISEIIGKTKKHDYSLEFSSKVDKDEVNSTFNFMSNPVIDSLSNNTLYKKTELSISGRYSYNLTRKLKISTRIKIAENFVNLNNNREQLFSINPSIRFNLKKTGIGNFGIGYSFKNNLPAIQYFNENFILKNYRSFTRGIGDILQIGNHNFNFFYTFADFKKQFLISTFLSHSFSNNSYGLQSIISERVNFNEYKIIDGNKFTNYNLNVSKYISPLSSSIKISTQQSWSITPTIINGVINEIENYNSNYRLQGTTYFELPINFKFALQYNRSKGKFNNQITSNAYFESLLVSTLKVSKKIILRLDNNYYSINNNDYLFTNMLISYNPRESKFSYRLTANNLSNINSYSNVYISEIQRNETSVRILPRYILVNIKYRF